jgi:hypothetical protein
MTFQKSTLCEVLEKLGVTLWVKGKPFGKIKDDGTLIGQPKCHSCNQGFILGVTLDGRQNVCKDCLDALRQLLYQLLKEQFPELLPEEVELRRG